MAGGFVGVGGTARKIQAVYVGVDGVARKITKAYVGVDGIARLWWEGDDGGGTPEWVGSTVTFSTGAYEVGAHCTTCCSTPDYAMFSGDDGSNSRPATTTVKAYNKNLVETTLPVGTSMAKREACTITHPAGYAIFGQGVRWEGSGAHYGVHTIDAFDNNMQRTNITPLMQKSVEVSGVVGQYGIFTNGINDHDGDGSDYHGNFTFAIDQNLAISQITGITQEDSGRNCVAGVSTGDFNHVLFLNSPGYSGSYYDANLVKGTVSWAHRLSAGSCKAGGYALAGGGWVSASDRPTNAITAYDDNMAQTTPTPLASARNGPVGGSLGKFGVFMGSGSYNGADVYDENLVRSNLTTSQTTASYQQNQSTQVGRYLLAVPNTWASSIGLQVFKR